MGLSKEGYDGLKGILVLFVKIKVNKRIDQPLEGNRPKYELKVQYAKDVKASYNTINECQKPKNPFNNRIIRV